VSNAVRRVTAMPLEEEHGTRNNLELSEPLRILKPEQILQVDRALASLGPFGEVRLVKVRGRLRFIERLESHDLFLSRTREGE
jgi:hypothetical protein